MSISMQLALKPRLARIPKRQRALKPRLARTRRATRADAEATRADAEAVARIEAEVRLQSLKPSYADCGATPNMALTPKLFRRQIVDIARAGETITPRCQHAPPTDFCGGCAASGSQLRDADYC